MNTHIRCIGNQLSEENIFVTVERVDNNIHKPRHLSLELEFLRSVAKCSLRNRLRLSKPKGE